MRTGRRWLALDADFMFNPFTARLKERYGAAGVVVWIAFLCACKRSRTPGTIHYSTEAHLLDQLNIHGLPLVDNQGKEWTLEALWKWTGTQKQSSRRRHGGVTHLRASHWERWQNDARRDANVQRMRTFRRAQNAHASRTDRAQEVHVCAPDIEREIDTPPTPPKGGAGELRSEKSKDNDNGTRVGPGAAAALKAAIQGKPG